MLYLNSDLTFKCNHYKNVTSSTLVPSACTAKWAQTTRAPCACTNRAVFAGLSPRMMIPAWTLLIISTPQDLKALTKTQYRFTGFLTEFDSWAGPFPTHGLFRALGQIDKDPPQLFPFPSSRCGSVMSSWTAFLPSYKSLGPAHMILLKGLHI